MYFLRALRPIASDFLSTIVFIAGFEITGNIVAGVLAGMATGILQIAWLKWRGRTIDLMQWASLGLVIVLGSATLVTRDPRFIMVKPSIVAFAIAAVMLRPNWLSRYMPPIVTENISPTVPLVWGYVWSASIFALGVANLVVAFVFGPRIWAWYTAFVPTAVELGLFLVQYVSIRQAVVRAIRARRAAAPA